MGAVTSESKVCHRHRCTRSFHSKPKLHPNNEWVGPQQHRAEACLFAKQTTITDSLSPPYCRCKPGSHAYILTPYNLFCQHQTSVWVKNSNIRHYKTCMFLNVAVKGVTWNIQMLVLRATDWAFITVCCWREVFGITDPVPVSSLRNTHQTSCLPRWSDFTCPIPHTAFQLKSEVGRWDWLLVWLRVNEWTGWLALMLAVICWNP